MIEIYSQNFDGVSFSIACSKHQILASSFGGNQQVTLTEILRNIPLELPFEVFHEPSVFARDILISIKNIYDGENVNTDFVLALNRLPVYTQKTLKATARIPRGYVSSYGSIAKAVGGGPRAVGNVMASNPFAPIIPCHRVVKSDFTLGGYGGGLKVKFEILSREKRGFSSPVEVEVNGRMLQVFPAEYSLRNFA
jgi:O-6-methylguanine DNA methyltransferase